jgi:hypothetical protein
MDTRGETTLTSQKVTYTKETYPLSAVEAGELLEVPQRG